LPAARAALAASHAEVADVDFLVFATMTADVTFPGSGVYLQDKLGCATIGALDIRGQCAGFLMGLMIADAYVANGMYRRVLLAASEVHSSGLDYSEKGMAVASLYGDGAGVAILGPAPTGLEAVVCHTDGRWHDRFWCEYPASRQHPLRTTLEQFAAGKHFPAIDFGALERFGREHMPAAISEVLERAGRTLDDVDCFISSHLMPSVAEESARQLGVPSSRHIIAGDLHGHLTAASLPVALREVIDAGRVGPGARVCLAACGAGFAWGAALLTL
jgi:3-oxoacyl-[acyl-carrier-protein] synthase-3